MTDDERVGGEGYDLVMPFVVTASHGGPYEDEAFVAGWQCGEIDTALRATATIGGSLRRQVLRALFPQVELIAMKHGLVVTKHQGGEGHDAEWADVTISESASGGNDD